MANIRNDNGKYKKAKLLVLIKESSNMDEETEALDELEQDNIDDCKNENSDSTTIEETIGQRKAAYADILTFCVELLIGIESQALF